MARVPRAEAPDSPKFRVFRVVSRVHWADPARIVSLGT